MSEDGRSVEMRGLQATLMGDPEDVSGRWLEAGRSVPSNGRNDKREGRSWLSGQRIPRICRQRFMCPFVIEGDRFIFPCSVPFFTRKSWRAPVRLD